MSAAAVRRDEWADAVFDAVRALRAALADPASGLKAAGELLRLEVARIRHGRPVAGSHPRDDPDPTGLPPLIELVALFASSAPAPRRTIHRPFHTATTSACR